MLSNKGDIFKMNKSIYLLLLLLLKKDKHFQDRLIFKATTVDNRDPRILCLLGPTVKKIEGGKIPKNVPVRRFRKYSVGKTLSEHQPGSLCFGTLKDSKGKIPPCPPGTLKNSVYKVTVQGKPF